MSASMDVRLEKKCTVRRAAVGKKTRTNAEALEVSGRDWNRKQRDKHNAAPIQRSRETAHITISKWRNPGGEATPEKVLDRNCLYVTLAQARNESALRLPSVVVRYVHSRKPYYARTTQRGQYPFFSPFPFPEVSPVWPEWASSQGSISSSLA